MDYHEITLIGSSFCKVNRFEYFFLSVKYICFLSTTGSFSLSFKNAWIATWKITYNKVLCATGKLSLRKNLVTNKKTKMIVKFPALSRLHSGESRSSKQSTPSLPNLPARPQSPVPVLTLKSPQQDENKYLSTVTMYVCALMAKQWYEIDRPLFARPRKVKKSL